MTMPEAPISPPVSKFASVEAALQGAARLHWLAIAQYAAQAEHFGRWGYAKLADAAREDAEEERGHLAKVMQRLEFYDLQPTTEHDQPAWPRHDFEGILASNLSLETAAMEAERAAVLVARASGDELSAGVFAALLAGSEKSVADITAAMRVIEQIGLDNYLANKT